MESDRAAQMTLDATSRAAIACNHCFVNLGVTRPTIQMAQPRWVGPAYWRSQSRVLVVMLNPGSGEARTDSGDLRFNRLLQGYAAGAHSLSTLFQHQREDFPNWGRGRFLKFYTAGLGIQIDSLAFVNIAWCATRGNKYPDPMLNACYERHTLSVIQALAPAWALLSGSKVHRFAKRLGKKLPNAKCVPMLHYAHREGEQAERDELQRIRTLIRAGT